MQHVFRMPWHVSCQKLICSLECVKLTYCLKYVWLRLIFRHILYECFVVVLSHQQNHNWQQSQWCFILTFKFIWLWLVSYDIFLSRWRNSKWSIKSHNTLSDNIFYNKKPTTKRYRVPFTLHTVINKSRSPPSVQWERGNERDWDE